MSNFRSLIEVLKKETTKQQTILELLAEERRAIVDLKQEELEALASKKDKIYNEATELQNKRNSLINECCSDVEKDRGERIKFADVIDSCPDRASKSALKSIGEELKELANSVKQMNSDNADLIKHSLGFISTTLTLMTSAPEIEVPTYGQSGSMKQNNNQSSSATTGRIRTSV